MDKIQIESFRQQLLKLQSELTNLSDTSADAAKPVELDQTTVGRLTRMDAMRAQAMAIETKARRDDQLVRIEGALQRISTGDFGLCLSCDEAISTRRLEIDPSYTHCINCST
jgi:DnaK suppressor protein